MAREESGRGSESWGSIRLSLLRQTRQEDGERRSLRARRAYGSCRSESGLEPPELMLLSLLPRLQEHPPSFLMSVLNGGMGFQETCVQSYRGLTTDTGRYV